MRAAEPMFRFAQLSDPHLTDPSSASLGQLAGKRLLGFLSWLRRRRREHLRSVLDGLTRDLAGRAPDHTVVTGDLTHISLPTEFRQAREWLDGLGSATDVTVIPGNHDAYVRVPWEESAGLWSDYMRADGGASGQTAFPTLRVRGPVAFIGLDSAVPTPPFLATGRLGQPQLGRLKDVLESLRGRPLLKVLLIHHPPAPGTEKWRKRLMDAPALCELLAEHPVDMVLHGHQHRPAHSAIVAKGRQIPVFGTPSASAAGLHSPHAACYNEYDVHPDGDGFQVEVKARRADVAGGRYVEELIARITLTGR